MHGTTLRRCDVDEDSKIGDVRTIADSASRPLVGDVVRLSLCGRRVVRTIIARYGQFLWVFESSSSRVTGNVCLRHTLTETDWRRVIETDIDAELLWGGEREINF